MSSTRARTFRIFLIGSEFYRSTGGIQQVNRMLLEALGMFGTHTPCAMEVFSYHDLPQHFPSRLQMNDAVRCHGFGRRRAAMAWTLTQRIRAVKPHLVIFGHVGLLRMAPLVRVLAPQARVAVLAFGIEVWQPLPALIRWALQRAEGVTAPSAYTRQKLIDVNGVRPERIAIIPYCLEAGWEDKNIAEPKTAPVGRTLLSVTRLSRADVYKGVDTMIQAMPSIRARCQDVRYAIVGDGEDRQRLERLAAELRVTDCVEFRGELRGEAVRRAYDEADVFVLPSKKEGFGIVFLEAMYWGLPVVAARAAGAVDVVVDGVTGILVPPDDVEQLAAAVSNLLVFPEERRKLGDAGRRRVEETFLFHHFASRWHCWLTQLSPEAVYLARQAAVFRNPSAAATVS